MTIDKIKMFLAVYEEGTVSKAAEVLYISQPAVTQGIKDLEDSFKVKLFDRVGRNLVLSEFGYQFLPYARQVIRTYNEAKSVFETKNQTLKLGATLTIASTLLAHMIQQFEKETGLFVEVFCNNKSKIEEMLDNDELDIALIEGIFNNEIYEYHPIGEFHLDLLGSVEYLDANVSQIYHCIARERGSTYREALERVCQKENILPKTKWTCTDNETVKEAIMKNQGIGILPIEAVQQEIRSGNIISVVNKDLKLREPYGIVVKKSKAYEVEIQRMIQYIKDTLIDNK